MNVGLLMRTDLTAAAFDELISLRDAYRVMETFVDAFVARGDGAVSEFLDFYVSSSSDGLAENSTAPSDFLAALAAVKASRA